MNPFVETIVVGAGQAGLATAYHLTSQGRECLVLDGNTRIGDNWRQQWDSLRLYSPAQFDGLPGMPFPADRWHYPTKDETAAFVEAYARKFELPVQLGVRVVRVSADGDGFRVEAEQGKYDARNVVVATGTFGRTPYVLGFAGDLDPAIQQLHGAFPAAIEELQLACRRYADSGAPRLPLPWEPVGGIVLGAVLQRVGPGRLSRELRGPGVLLALAGVTWTGLATRDPKRLDRGDLASVLRPAAPLGAPRGVLPRRAVRPRVRRLRGARPPLPGSLARTGQR